jgi:hypothetical protein
MRPAACLNDAVYEARIGLWLKKKKKKKAILKERSKEG